MRREALDEQVFTGWQIGIEADDLALRVGSAAARTRLKAEAARLLARLDGCWRPRAVVRWFEVVHDSPGQVLLAGVAGEPPVPLVMGHTATFLAAAESALVAVYTAGDQLELTAIQATAENRFLDGYLLDLIGLAVLEKTGRRINQLAEEQARRSGWGVGPVLSPGSVHGWGIEDQLKLCRLLAIDRIGVVIDNNGILHPYKSLTALIGIGPGYREREVQSPCMVCSRNDNCQMRKGD